MKPAARKIAVLAFALCLALSSAPLPARAGSEKITFAVIGDYGLAGQPLLDVSNLVKSWNPDFIVTAGDNNYPHGQSSTIDDNIGQYFHEYIFRYKGKYGSGSPTRRFYPTLGNHDWGTTDGKPYLDYFGFGRYYEFTQGPAHFFMLDSDRNEPDGYTADSQQGIWLRKALAASASPYNVVVFHHSPYSSGRHGSSEYMRWPFKEWGADVVLTGHDHIYERLLVNGLPYFVNGIGGDEYYNYESILPESQARFNQDYGAMRVEATSLYMRFQMFTRSGALVDEFTLGAQAPFVASIARLDASPSNLQSVNYQVTFTEPVAGVDISDFILNTNINGASITGIGGSGNSYFVSVDTGFGDGNLRLDATDDDSITTTSGVPLGWEGVGNGNFASAESYAIDKTAPSAVSITRASPNPSNAASVDFAATFSEPVTGVDAADFSLVTSNGAAVLSVNGSGANYLISVATGTGNDALRLDFLDDDSVADPGGNFTPGGFANGESYTVDRAAPVITSISPAGQAEGFSVEYAVSFSEPVTGVDGSDFFLSTLNGAAIANVSGQGSQYAVSVSVQPGSDSIRLDGADNDSIMDALGNPLGGAGMGNGNFLGGIVNIAIDTPIATSIIRASADPTNAASVDYIVTFSEFVEGVDAGDFTIANGSIVNIQNLSPFFIVTVSTGASDGEMRLNLADDDSIRSAQGIPLGGNGIGNANFAGAAYTIDRAPPRVTSIVRAGNNPAINSTADFIVTFSEPVIGVEQSDFVVTGSNVVKSSIIALQNANPFYWAQVLTGAGSGTIRLDLFDHGNIADLAGNPLANNNYVSGESFALAKIPVDFPAPSINEIPRALTNSPFPLPSWSPVWNAQAYEVFLARDSGFSQIVLAQTVTETSILLSSPLPDGSYYMRVRAYDLNLNPGKFSKAYFFTLDTTPPAAPNLRSPANGSSTPKKPQLSWSAAPGAAQYEIQVDNNADFSSPEFSAATGKTLAQSKTLLARKYYWRVRAKDAAGNWSAWSAVFSFTVR